MPFMSDVRSLAANTVVDNVLVGKLHEFVTRPSLVRLRACGSAAGLRCSFLIAGESQVQDQEIGSQNRTPIYPDDVLVEGFARPGDRLVLTIRNTTAGALTAQTIVDVIPQA